MKYICRFQDRAIASQMGGKGWAIAQLYQKGFLVPSGFILTPLAFLDSLTQAQRGQFQTLAQLSLSQIKPLPDFLGELKVGDGVKLEILQALADLFPYGGRFAVRSSAVEEDGEQQSFAGQLDSFLGVAPEDLYDKIAQVWQSAFSDRLLSYRQQQGLPHFPAPPAVIVQQMLNPTLAGVAFAADPITGRRNWVTINAVYGLGNALVSGEWEGDHFLLDPQNQIIQRHLVEKRLCDRLNKQGEVERCQLPADLLHSPTLTDEQLQRLATLTRQISHQLGAPQDIEWAQVNQQTYILQARPITALPPLPPATGVYRIWDNSNIAESYSGVTTPLTFSFARQAYEEVYRQFCRLMGVSPRRIAQHQTTFENMIGLLEGRIYYNLLNWYRVLALLPGFRLNRAFMEQMMGVKESLPEELVQGLDQSSWRDRLQDSGHLLRTLAGLLLNYLLLPLKIRRFYRRLQRLLSPAPDFSTLAPEDLAQYYRTLASQLLPRWDAPILNDFFAMIFYGLLRKLTEKWCGDTDGTLQNGLLTQRGGMISAEPAQRIRALAALAAPHPKFIEMLSQEPLERILAAIEQFPEFKSSYEDYLHKFSDRCLDELKLESPTLSENPLPLLRTIGALAHPPSRHHSTALSRLPEPVALRVRRILRRYPLRRLVFKWVLVNARQRLRQRENLRFERTRVFGRARQLFLELGQRFYTLDLLQQPRDIFYLEVGEILALLEGTSTCNRVKDLVALRQAEFEDYRRHSSLGDRVATFGIPSLNPTAPPLTPVSSVTTDSKQGLGCSPGIVRAPVRIITDPQQALTSRPPLQPGTILVAERTDPGWILLFPLAVGLLVERGSLLSHAAIVSRELGLPAVISLPGITQWLKDGDWVELDGSTGRVRKVGLGE
ncbi:phosphoenolpyruvate synthase [Spirulina subsalsa FACHB-351]|uniref:Phosphoenolpyruvate synthase n=1 Tax=Spirulina subsalsa FACHB-351 TaxID=234711 RepID=A0ABT3L6A6_9CYAN|nr:PEP/pyruvate-binding domain-containing protein [Spirulina subsalsa]MCW6037034.1 phosphoenolpyruvate synthase [Spirulina subsalsa FACHB-351]